MRKFELILSFWVFYIFSNNAVAQTTKDVQGTWICVTSNMSGDNWKVKMDSTTHHSMKIITPGRIIFTIYNKKTDSLEVTGQGRAMTKGNQYFETFEQANQKDFPREPVAFTYKVVKNKMFIEGGNKDFHVVETWKKVE